MREELRIAADYRKHAEELRVVAGEGRPRWANEALLKAADDYDRLAAALARPFGCQSLDTALPA
jgi:hypothetical protein